MAVLEFFSDRPIEVARPLLEALANIGTQLGRVVERSRAESALRAGEQRLRQVIDTAHDAFVGVDGVGLINDWNRQAEITFGWTRAEVLGRPLIDLVVPPQIRDDYQAGLKRFHATGKNPIIGRRVEMAALHRDGHEFPIELTAWAVGGDHGVQFNSFVQDITERKAAKEALIHQALHDPLTGLPHRRLVGDRLGQALRRADRRASTVAVLFLDLDHFKAVNDSYGHDAGDQVLIEISRRLRSLRNVARAVDGASARRWCAIPPVSEPPQGPSRQATWSRSAPFSSRSRRSLRRSRRDAPGATVVTR